MKILGYVFLGFCAFGLMISAISYYKPPLEFDTGFSGTMNPSVGYEGIPWGTKTEDINKYGRYPISETGRLLMDVGTGRRVVHCGATEIYLRFYNRRLYSVEEIIPVKSTDIDSLHARYGAFSAAPDSKKKYTNKASYAFSESLYIEQSRREYRVICYDPLVYNTLKLQRYGEFQFDADRWYTLASTDCDESMQHWYFIKKNSDDKYMLIRYNRSLLSENRSTVRAGYSLEYGDCEIKANGIVIAKKYDCIRLNDSMYDFDWFINYDTGTSSREMLELILQEQPVQIRKNGEVYSFDSSGINDVLFDWGITTEELDYALGNEEF